MCLEIGSERLEAQENITCYKVLQVKTRTTWLLRRTEVKYLTPFKGFNIKIGEEYKTKRDFEIKDNGRNVCGGAFHSFLDRTSAVALKQALSDAVCHYCVVECTIPKGALYYKGVCYKHFAGFASNRIIINKIIE